MATSVPNPTPDPRPTGDLEHLFQQKFAEAEVTPRAGLWEQLDHELLVEQNNAYRRRLIVHRWVAAACLLFFLSLGGWALLRQWKSPIAGLAAGGRAASGTNAVVNIRSGLASANTNPDDTTADAATENAPLLANAALASPVDELLAAENAIIPLKPGLSGTATYKQAVAGTQATGAVSRRLAVGTFTNPGFVDSPYITGRSGVVAAQFDSQFPTTESSLTVSGWNSMAPRFAGLRGGWFGSRPDTLKASLLAAPQPAIGALAAQDQTQMPPAKLWRRLRLGGSYAASSYNPNINFSQSNGQALAYTDAVSSALRNYYQDDAETEYRRNLRAGLSQRVAFTAAYVLNKRLTVASGVEAGQQTATSATSYDFLDGQQVSRGVADLFNNAGFTNALSIAAPAAMRKASYRYRTVAVPVEIRYGSPRTGASLYAKVGAAVGLLLSTKSELQEYSGATRTTAFTAGNPTNTTRRYSLSSNSSPYRKVQGSVRGGAGVRYQPANATWNLALGTTTEMGVTTLNADPGQRGFSQSRPYSVGVEASVEFNSHKPAPTAP